MNRHADGDKRENGLSRFSGGVYEPDVRYKYHCLKCNLKTNNDAIWNAHENGGCGKFVWVQEE